MLLINTHNKNLWGEIRKIYQYFLVEKYLISSYASAGSDVSEMQPVLHRSLALWQSDNFETILVARSLGGFFSSCNFIWYMHKKSNLLAKSQVFIKDFHLCFIFTDQKYIYIFFLIWHFHSLFTHSNKCLFCFSQSDCIFCWSHCDLNTRDAPPVAVITVNMSCMDLIQMIQVAYFIHTCLHSLVEKFH